MPRGEPSSIRSAALILATSGIFGALGVAMGAFGAHAVPAITSPERVDTFNTGAAYHMYHALAMVGSAAMYAWTGSRPFLFAWWLFVLGTVLFSGSLYVLVLADVPALAIITPFGGAAFILGWLLFAWAAIRAGRAIL